MTGVYIKITAILGSPHKNGNTALLLSAYLSGVLDAHPDAVIKNVILADLNIAPCNACNACKNADDSKCILEDDMSLLYVCVEKSDVLIFATPIYWWNMTAQMKTYIDRLYAMKYDKRVLKNKKIVFLTTFGAPDFESSGANIVKQSLQRIASFTGMGFIHSYGVTSQPENNPAFQKALIEVFDLGKSLIINY
ncbi:MAG: flavodoxin family protein [Candidatus Cloacimonetes bacterium]|nr:flavodoxin family protein [Candidatus Cloacimonadota bacterium]